MPPNPTVFSNQKPQASKPERPVAGTGRKLLVEVFQGEDKKSILIFLLGLNILSTFIVVSVDAAKDTPRPSLPSIKGMKRDDFRAPI